ncbi:peptidoglycan editing factor PgeF [Novilysobacter erysipheiresistens]|uniref:Purine nucleoside phosphorylase n=1 Tax=Novilysobacter erysipheiresistens TaxID=1749332 RepID=A0ABU7YYM1_9GAMM
MARALLPADWPAPRQVRAFTTLRHGAGVSESPFDDFNMGSRCGDAAEAVARNRAELIEAGGLPSAPVWLRQVHGVQVFRADASVGEAEPEADAAVTSAPGTVLVILTADCLPVLFCADDGSEVGAAHAGWRGLAAGVLEATVAEMRTPPERLLAWLGPAAGPESYEVGVEVYDAFVAQDWTAGSAFTSTRPHHWKVDLYALAGRRLERAGVNAGRIHGGGLDTIGEPQRFYSHRRDQRTGRMASLVWIEPAR